jgi:hypothetical protein
MRKMKFVWAALADAEAQARRHPPYARRATNVNGQQNKSSK